MSDGVPQHPIDGEVGDIKLNRRMERKGEQSLWDILDL